MKVRMASALVVLLVLLALPAATDATTLTLKWSSLSSSIKPGAYATANVTTTPGATCGITVKLATTLSKSAGLITQKAPSTGHLTWHWKTGTTTRPGTWRVTITCKLGSATLSIWRTMTIVKTFTRTYHSGAASLTTFAAGTYYVTFNAGGCKSWKVAIAPTSGATPIPVHVIDGSGTTTVALKAMTAYVNSSALCAGSAAWSLTLYR